ncbi:MAG TPA: DMT family transporter [Candidatus Nanopelagicaceae bacterium]
MKSKSDQKSGTLIFGLITVIAGVLSSVQSRANGQLSVDIHNAIGAAAISNIVGWALLWILLFGRKRERTALKTLFRAIKSHELKWWELLGGMGGAYFLAIQSFAVPQVGVGIFTICAVSGQAASSLLVDKVGLSMNGKQHITWPRVVAALLTLVAVTISVYPDLGKINFKVVTVILCVLVGVIGSFQHALNSRVNHVSQRPIVTTWLNFMIGLVILLIVLAINLAGHGSLGKLPTNIWVYIGGPMGVIFIAVASNVVRHLGVLNFILFSVTGQLIGALLLDWLMPAHKGALSGYLVFGTAMTLGSILLSRLFPDKNSNPNAVSALTEVA